MLASSRSTAGTPDRASRSWPAAWGVHSHRLLPFIQAGHTAARVARHYCTYHQHENVSSAKRCTSAAAGNGVSTVPSFVSTHYALVCEHCTTPSFVPRKPAENEPLETKRMRAILDPGVLCDMSLPESGGTACCASIYTPCHNCRKFCTSSLFPYEQPSVVPPASVSCHSVYRKIGYIHPAFSPCLILPYLVAHVNEGL